MRGIRRKEKKIESEDEMIAIIESAKYVTIEMSVKDEPYLATLSHGVDREKNCIYFHCAQEGKKVDILKENNVVWGQALEDHGYAGGEYRSDRSRSRGYGAGKAVVVPLLPHSVNFHKAKTGGICDGGPGHTGKDE